MRNKKMGIISLLIFCLTLILPIQAIAAANMDNEVNGGEEWTYILKSQIHNATVIHVWRQSLSF